MANHRIADCEFSERSQTRSDNCSPNGTRFAHEVTTTSLLRRREALQLLVEVLDDDDLRRRRIRIAHGFKHEEPLPVRRDIVASAGKETQLARHVSLFD